MYPLKPLKVFALRALHDDPRCMARMERMLDAVEPLDDRIVWITEHNMSDVVEELLALWPPSDTPEATPITYTRPFVFTRVYTGDGVPEGVDKLLQWPGDSREGIAQAIRGYFEPIHNYHPFDSDQKENRVCWPTWDFGTMMGCPHGCHYCGYGRAGKFFTIGLNLEEFMDTVVPRTIRKFPWQKCFRMIGWSADMIAFEPEYGCFDLYTRKLADFDRWGYFHAASPNVDWIADLPRRDRLIAIFSVTCEAVGRDIEPGTGHAFDRFDAGRKCNEFGVPVRYKFKPTIPVKNWREEYARAVHYALEVSHPESMGFCVIMWMPLQRLQSIIDLDLLDTDFVQAAQDAQEQMRDNVCGPFPHHVRKEIYRHFIREARRWDQDVRLFLSTESREMWDELKDELGQDPRSFVCGCSSVALPGPRISLSEACPHSTYSPFTGANAPRQAP